MRRCCIILLTLSALLLAACGGDSPPDRAALGSPDNPIQAQPNPEPTRVPATSETGPQAKSSTRSRRRTGRRRRSDVEARKRTQARNERTRASREAKANATAAKRRATTASRGPRKQKALAPSAKRPCSLVTKAQARAIIGVAILEPLEAPQGPTCIYQSRSGKRFITLTVQTTDFAMHKAQMRKRRNVTVSDRVALCGSLGRPMLYLPLNGGRVLSISGPCDMATRFAAKAEPRL